MSCFLFVLSCLVLFLWVFLGLGASLRLWVIALAWSDSVCALLRVLGAKAYRNFQLPSRCRTLPLLPCGARALQTCDGKGRNRRSLAPTRAPERGQNPTRFLTTFLGASADDQHGYFDVSHPPAACTWLENARTGVIARAWSVGCLRDRTKDVANFFLDVNFPSSYCHVTPIRYRPVTGGLFAFVFSF